MPIFLVMETKTHDKDKWGITSGENKMGGFRGGEFEGSVLSVVLGD